MALNERDRRALILGGAAILVIGLYFRVVEPAAARYQRMIKTHETAATQLARTLRDRQKDAYLQKQVSEWEQKSGALGTPKLYGEGVTAVGSQIIAAAQSSGVDLQGATPGAATPWAEDSQLQEAIVQIEGKADWENVFKFIAALYRVEGILSVEQMDLSAADPKKPGKLNLRLGVSVLLQAEPGGGTKWAK